MTALVSESPRVVHAIPGRVRIHLPGWAGSGTRRLEGRLRALPGVRRVQANPVTGNVLVQFEPHWINSQAILETLQGVVPETAEAPPEPPAPPVVADKPRHGRRRVRIPMRGLNRAPALARIVVDRLQRLPGVKASANPLTDRVLVEFDERLVELDHLVAEVMEVELPPLPGEDVPSHPLDPAPLIQSATRTAGATAGLALIAFRQLRGATGPPPGARAYATTANVLTFFQSFPFLRNGLRHLLGRHGADLALSSAGLFVNTLAGSPLNLVSNGLEALRLLTEVVARRKAWRHYEERLGNTPATEPGSLIRLDAGERPPRPAVVVEGTGTATGRDGLPVPLSPGSSVTAGARLAGGPFVLELQAGEGFEPQPRPAPLAPSLYTRYVHVLGPLSLAYAIARGLWTRSPTQGLLGLMLVNPRPALVGSDMANLNAAARVLRAGVTVVGTRPHRSVRRPDTLLIDGTRLLVDGQELSGTLPLDTAWEATALQALAAGVASASGCPWGGAFPPHGHAAAQDGHYDGRRASATFEGARYTLGPVRDWDSVPASMRSQHRGDYLLLLHREGHERPLGVCVLRPKLVVGVADLLRTCQQHGVELAVLTIGDAHAAQAIARRAGIPLLPQRDALGAIHDRQTAGQLVAFVSDSAHAGASFEACDLAIGLSAGRSTRFCARADLLAPDLCGVAAVVEAGARREAAARDAVGFSTLSNLFGAVWGFRARPGAQTVSLPLHIASLCTIVDSFLRLRGGERSGSSLAYLTDPRPERWGRRSISSVLRAFGSSETGLTSELAAARRRHALPPVHHHELLSAFLEQLRYPTTTILAAGAGLSLLVGNPLDAAIIGATVLVNAVVGAWQEHQAGQTAEGLKRLSTASARVLRDGRAVTVSAADVVPGDILILAAGDRVAADARLIAAESLEVDEAALTGESLPVPKMTRGGGEENHIVLEGSDVVVGTGRAVIVAVGRNTRLGATAAALTLEEAEASPLGMRLGRLLYQTLPLAATGGAVAVAAGVLRGRPLLSELTIGATIALAAVPEGLPMLAGIGEAASARRLARRGGVVRRLSSVEALGRVNVVCTDKTGTLTEGRLHLALVANGDHEARVPGPLPDDLRSVLLTAGLASPHPDAADAVAHPTDAALVRGAQEAGLGNELRARREQEAPFGPGRNFHAAAVGGRLVTKGAPEALLARCTRQRIGGTDRPLDDAARRALLDRTAFLAGQGLRVLLVAEGPPFGSVLEPHELTALGFVGIRDPLRTTVPDAVRRCQEAGVRVVMITGDHPETARTIAREAGILGSHQEVLTGAELAELHNGDLERRLEGAAIIARATPIDKVRIVEGLQRLGYTVAMTGDGVNDAPALRLADVGVAMGRVGTEVARQAADIVLSDDDFSTLVEAFVEGRGFWGNMRRALSLLLGGNLGELGLIVSAGAMGLASPLNTRQILTVNLITDALPAFSVVMQAPEHRRLASLAREGTTALDAALRRDVLRRGIVAAGPTLAAYLLARARGGAAEAGSVAFAGIIANQLVQTLDAGWSEGTLSPSVAGAVAGSGGVLLAALTVPALRTLLGLGTLTPYGWSLIGAGAATALCLSRLWATGNAVRRVLLPQSMVNPRTQAGGAA